MAHDVFVSHSTKDAEVAAAIVTRLEAESIRCWIAPRDVVPGADWGESIIDAIESSRIMILVFSRNANASRQIKREVERADHKRVYTIPFRIDDTEPTKSLAYFISTAHWMDAFQPPLERHLDTLAKTIAAKLSGSPPPPPPPPAIPKIAGVWRDSGYPGNVSQITQDENRFTFTKRGTAPNGTPFEASGSGTISGLQIESRYDATWYPAFQIPIRSWAKCSGSVSADGMHMKLTCEDSRFGVFSGEANREP